MVSRCLGLRGLEETLVIVVNQLGRNVLVLDRRLFNPSSDEKAKRPSRY